MIHRFLLTTVMGTRIRKKRLKPPHDVWFCCVTEGALSTGVAER